MPKYNIFLENTPEFLNGKKFLKIIKTALDYLLSLDVIQSKSALRGFEYKSLSFDIVFCDDEKIREINKEYRGKDCATDVITFAIFADSDPKFIIDGDVALGEIIISTDTAKRQASEHIAKELFTLVTHGILHLLSFDHQDNESYNFIVGIQKKAMESVKISIEELCKKCNACT